MWTLSLLACTLLGDDPDSGPPAPEPVVEPVPAEPSGPPPGVEPTEARYAGSHILIAWKGAVQAPSGVERTEAEARALAEQLRERARTEPFEDLARAHSDDPSGRRGGRLGVWRTGTMVPDFERVVASVEPGALGPVVRTPFGWHVVRRDAIEEVEVAHIQVAWAGALRATVERTKDEARARIDGLRARLAAGEPFAAVADAESDDTGAGPGGALGVIARGQMMPSFEDAAFALAPGATSDIVETPYGFHLVLRLR